MIRNGVAVKQDDTQNLASRSEIKSMVKNVVDDLERLHDDLSDVIGDLRSLVCDIDQVTERVEKELDEKNIGIDKFFTSTPLQSASETIQRRNSLTEFKVIDESPDLDLSYLHFTPVPQPPKWGRSLSHPAPRTPEVQRRLEVRSSFNATSLVRDIESFRSQVPKSQHVAKCFAQFKKKDDIDDAFEIYNQSNESNHISTSSEDSDVTYKEIVPKTKSKHSDSTYKEIVPSETGTVSTVKNVKADNEKLQRIFSINGVKNVPLPFESNVFSDKAKEDVCKCSHDQNSASNKIIWNSMSSSNETPAVELSYEKDMENLLENLVEISSQSGLSDCDMDNDSHEDTHSNLSDWNPHNDVDINTWKTYALTHMSDSTKSSDSFVSDTPSDILNDNTRATALYGNMIFSDNLVILSSKRQKNKHTTF